jgi:hypothetical protein
MHEVDFTDAVGFGRRFSQNVLFRFFQSVRQVPADFFGLLLPGLFRPSLSQLVVLPVHTECEKKKDQGRQKNRDPK